MNWKGFGRKRSGLIADISRDYHGGTEEKRKYLRRANVPADIRTQHLPNECKALPLPQPARYNECVIAYAVKKVASWAAQQILYCSKYCLHIRLERLARACPGLDSNRVLWQNEALKARLSITLSMQWNTGLSVVLPPCR
jgi:hypothetical protein